MLELLTRRVDISTAQQTLRDTLKEVAGGMKKLKISRPGEEFDVHCYVLPRHKIWFHPGEQEGKYWNCLGAMEPSRFGTYNIDLEVNPPYSDRNAHVQGVYARCTETGAVFLAHRGGLGGNAVGSSRHAFWRHADLTPQTLDEGEGRYGSVVPLVRVDDLEGIGDGLAAYHRRVVAFKDLLKLAKEGDAGAEEELMRLNDG